MSTRDSEDYISDASNGIFWSLLLSSALIHIPLSLPGISTQVALFDLILPVIAFRLIWREGFRVHFGVGNLIFAIILGVLLAHSLGIFLFKPAFQSSWLLKETTKSAILIIEFQMLLFLFKSKAHILPPIRTVNWIFIAASVGIAVLAYIMLEDEPFFFARTVYCVALTAVFFLLASDEEWTHSQHRRWVLVAAGVLVAAISILSLSKGITGLVLTMTAWLALSPSFRRVTAGHIVTIAVSATLIAILGILIAKLAGGSFEPLQRMDSIERSISVRLSLWTVGLNAFEDSFPWGLGLGQYWQAVVSDISLAREGHRFVHNSFISLIAELGLLGILYSAGLIALVVTAARGWPPLLQPIFLLLVFVPLTIHDGHSIRMLLIVTALGLARYLYKTKNLD